MTVIGKMDLNRPIICSFVLFFSLSPPSLCSSVLSICLSVTMCICLISVRPSGYLSVRLSVRRSETGTRFIYRSKIARSTATEPRRATDPDGELKFISRILMTQLRTYQ